jgi:hypothetical protein
MKKLPLVLTALFLISSALFSASGYKMVKNLTVPEGDTYDKSILSWGGAIQVNAGGAVNGSVIMLGGSFTLDGLVEEDVICVATTIKLGQHARIKGDFYVIAGELTPPGKDDILGKVGGEYLNFKFNLKKIESTLIPIISDSQSIAFFKALKIVFWLIVTLIVLAIAPRKVNLARDIFSAHLLKTGAIGIITLFTFICLLFVFIILCFVIVGFPLLFALVLAYFAAYIFGRTVMFYYIGHRLANRFERLKNITPALFVVIGALFYTLLKFLPVVGPVLLIIMNIFEVGIGAGFFFRKKLKLER